MFEGITKVAIIGTDGKFTKLAIEWINSYNPQVILKVVNNVNELTEEYDMYFVDFKINIGWKMEQDISILTKNIRYIPENKPVWITSPITTKSFKLLKKLVHDRLHFIPDLFLENATIEDFKTAKLVFTGNRTEVINLRHIFRDNEYMVVDDVQAITARYCHEMFDVLKKTYFNCIDELCTIERIDFEPVRQAILSSGRISAENTSVPDENGKKGFDRNDLIVNMLSFLNYVKSVSLGKLLKIIPQLNKKFLKNCQRIQKNPFSIL